MKQEIHISCSILDLICSTGIIFAQRTQLIIVNHSSYVPFLLLSVVRPDGTCNSHASTLSYEKPTPHLLGDKH